MKILFVSRNDSNIIAAKPIVLNQGKSLENNGVNVDYYTFTEKGLFGYIKNSWRLRRYLRRKEYDVIHAHYSLSAFATSLAGAKRVVVSLMGSDSKSSFIHRWIIALFAFCFSWESIIVKSEDMRKSLGIKRSIVIPNGVDLSYFKPIDKRACQKSLDWDLEKKHILFAGNPTLRVKNFTLAESAIGLVSDNFDLHVLNFVPHSEMLLWYNAADIVILTSLWEGSPNVIKEAMACNKPIVATDVGDIAYLFGDLPGHYLCRFDAEDIANKITQALNYSSPTNGRSRII